jgi:SnoaL-like polyketide cyclase
MAEHGNEELARRFYEEFWTRGRADAADDLVAEDLVHEQFPEGWPRGREGFKRLVTTWRAAFPDMVFAQLGALPADLSGIAGPLHAA